MFDIENILQEEQEANESLDNILTEANVVKMDKATLRRRLLNQSILLAAKDAQDPLYAKYVKASKLKKSLRDKIRSKYANAGKKKMKEFLKAKKALDAADKK